MFKRILSAILIALMLTLVFVSCGNDPETPENGGENTDTPENGENNGENSNVPNDNPQGLEFTLKSDDTYKVDIGNAKNLAKIEIPATYKDKAVTEIGSFGTASTEAPNTTLTEITIPASIVTVNENAFYGCSALTKVNTTDIAKWCGISFANNFANPLYFAKALYVNGELLTDLVVPESVTIIGTYTFYNCKSLTNLTLHDGVTLIDNGAFSGSSVVTVDLGEGLNAIGDSAFMSCSAIIDLIIPDSVTTIGVNAFFGCSGMKTLDIGLGVTTIGNSAFTSCSGLTKVEINDLAHWCSITFSNIASNPSCYAYKLYLNDELLTDLVIPDTVTTVNARAFYNCSTLISVTIPSTVVGIGDSTFQNCNKLIEVINRSALNINAGDTTNGYVSAYAKEVHSGESKITSIGDYRFYTYNGVNYLIAYAGNDTELVFPESFNGKNYCIYNNAFYSNKQLKSVTIPGSVTEICEYAFYNCNTMTTVVLGEGIKTIGNGAFIYCNAITGITIPNSVTTIGDTAFLSCISMTELNIGTGVTTIGTSAFSNCNKLNGVNIADFEQWCNITFGDYYANPLSGAKLLYVNGELLTDAVVPEGVTAIGNYAFFYCDSITSIVLPDSVTSIGDFAFYSCMKLTSITLGEGMNSVGASAFQFCYRLSEVINHSDTEIVKGSEDNGFIGCYAIEIHKEESKIVKQDNYLFYVYDKGNFVISYVGNDTELVLPDDFNGETYAIGNYAFCNSDAITSVTFSEGVIAIGDFAFIDCNGLKTVNLSESITQFGSGAFQYCNVLANVHITNVEKWCTVYFADADANPISCARKLYVNGVLLTEFIVPTTVTTISPYAFYYCNSLTTVTLHAGVTDIGHYAFRFCYTLAEVVNLTDMPIRPNSTDFGLVARYAKEVHAGESKIVTKGDYLFYTYKGVNYLIGYTGTATDITLPESFNGQTYEVYDYAFYYNKTLTSVVIPDNVTALGNNAFRFCNSITTVTLGSKLTDIGTGVFNGCSSLTAVTFKNTKGWSADGNSITADELADTEQASNLLKGTYVTAAWKRS